jgi:hypothetical protein
MLKLVIYLFLLIIYVLNLNFLFINEEFIIFICLFIFFSALITLIKSNINKYFFNKIQFIYFSFMYLIKINRNLIFKISNLIKILKLKFLKLDVIENFGYFLNISNLIYKELNFYKFFITRIYSLEILNKFNFNTSIKIEENRIFIEVLKLNLLLKTKN